jgi:sugar/nucleoside kinase (ribokinase family)
MKTIGTFGSATQDIFMMYEGAETAHLHLHKGNHSYLFFEQGIKVDIPAIHRATGGGATNTAVGFKRLGLNPQPFFKVGDDPEGEFIKKELLSQGISLTGVITDPKVRTALSCIIPSIEHNHVAFCYREANKFLSSAEVDFERVGSCDYLYISALSGSSRALFPDLIAIARRRSIPVAANPGIAQLSSPQFSLTGLSILIVNAYEARHLLTRLLDEQEQSPLGPLQGPPLLKHFLYYKNREYTLRDYFRYVLRRGVSIAVVTNGAEGVYVATKEKLYFHPSISTSAHYGLGAGDAFSSAFVGSHILGISLEQSIVFGALNASSVISNIDAKTGLLTHAELEKRAATVPPMVKTFDLL